MKTATASSSRACAPPDMMFLYVVESFPGADDEVVYRSAFADGRVLLTNDLDFGLIAERSSPRPPAIVLMRLDRLQPRTRAGRVVAFFGSLAGPPAGKFFAIEPGGVRERRLL